MVQIPRAPISQANITSLTTAPKITDPSSFTRIAEAASRVGTLLTAQAEEFKKLENFRQSSKGTVKGNRDLTEIEERILTSPELTEVASVNQFNQESALAIQNILSGITDERTRLALQVKLEGTQIVKGFNIKGKGRDRDMANAELETEAVEVDAVNNILKLKNTKEGSAQELIIRGNLVTHYNEQISIGYKTQEQIRKRLREFDESVRVGKAKTMAIENPGAFLEIKEKFDLTADELEDLVRLSNSLLKNEEARVKRDVKKVQTKTSADRTLELYGPNRNDEEFIKQLDKDLEENKISETSYIKKRNALLKDKTNAINDPATVTVIALEALRLAEKDTEKNYLNATAEDIDEFEALFQRIDDAVDANKIKSDKITSILKPILPVLNEALDDAAEKQVIKENPRRGWERITLWVDNFSEADVQKVKSEMLIKLMDILSNPDADIDEAADKIIKEEQDKMHPEWSGLKVGDMHDTVLGSRKILKILGNGEPDMELLPGDLEALERLRNQ